MNIYVLIIQVYLTTFSKHNDNSKNTKFYHLSQLIIPKILMNFVSCHAFVKYSISTVILTFCNARVTYYHPKVFVTAETEVGRVDNILTTVRNKSTLINYINRTVIQNSRRLFLQLLTHRKIIILEMCLKIMYQTFMMTVMLIYITQTLKKIDKSLD